MINNWEIRAKSGKTPKRAFPVAAKEKFNFELRKTCGCNSNERL